MIGARYFMKSMVARGLKNSTGSPNLQGLDAQATDEKVEHQARTKHACEQRRSNADHQRHRKPLDGAAAVLEEHDPRDERRELTVEDGPKRTVEALVDGRARGLAGPQLLAD